RGQLVQLAFAGGFGLCGQVGLAGLVVEQADLGAGIVHHDEVVQPVAVEVRHVQLAHLAVDGEYLGAGEAEAVGIGSRRQGMCHETCAGGPDNATANPSSEPGDSLQSWCKLPPLSGIAKEIVWGLEGKRFPFAPQRVLLYKPRRYVDENVRSDGLAEWWGAGRRIQNREPGGARGLGICFAVLRCPGRRL